MRTLNRLTALTLAGLLVVGLVPARALAGTAEGVVTEADLDQALAGRVDREDGSREAILSLLRRPEVVEMAGDLNLDLARMEDAVATLDGPELEKLGARAGEAETALAGGQKNITISITTLLLIIIIIILVT